MLAYVIRRLLSTILVMGIVGVFVFLLLHLSPATPSRSSRATTPRRSRSTRSAGSSASTSAGRPVRALGRPSPHGDFGTSIFSNEPVLKLVGQRLEPTVSLAFTTLIIAVTLAVTFGVLAAWKAGT